jgi:hypothetical protein
VPNVIGLSPGAAQGALSNRGYSSVGSCTTGGSTPSPGVVTYQNPSGGSPAGRGTVVQFTYTVQPTLSNPKPC